MKTKIETGNNSGIISTGENSNNTIIQYNIKDTNDFSIEADKAVKNVLESSELTEVQKEILTEIINDVKKATQDKNKAEQDSCKKTFKVFIGGAGEIVKATLKTILPPLFLSFFGLSK